MRWVLVCCCLAALIGISAAKSLEVENTFHCPKASGHFLDPKSCNHWYSCHKWHATQHDCGGNQYNPWTDECVNSGRYVYCKVWTHPENHDHKETYYINFHENHFTWDEGEEKCGFAGLDLVSIENWDEDTFVKEFTLEYEDKYPDPDHPNHRQTYWSSGRRQTSHNYRDFQWSATGEFVGYTDWCDAGLKSKGPLPPMYPANCDPDYLDHKCIQFNSSYIESYGWWDAGACGWHKLIICEHNSDPNPTTHVPPTTRSTEPTTKKTTTEATTTPEPPTTTPHGPYDGEFLPWDHCTKEGYFGFCEKWYTCIIEGPNIIRHGPFDCDEGTVFFQATNSCVPLSQTHGECEKPTNPCTEAGIFRDKRNCAKFYACVDDGSGGFHQHDYRCPDGWLYDDGTGYKNTCERPNWGQPTCPYAYEIEPPVELDASTQCQSKGVFADVTDQHHFLHCNTKKDDDTWGQNGPYTCPHGATYNEFDIVCEL